MELHPMRDKGQRALLLRFPFWPDPPKEARVAMMPRGESDRRLAPGSPIRVSLGTNQVLRVPLWNGQSPIIRTRYRTVDLHVEVANAPPLFQQVDLLGTSEKNPLEVPLAPVQGGQVFGSIQADPHSEYPEPLYVAAVPQLLGTRFDARSLDTLAGTFVAEHMLARRVAVALTRGKADFTLPHMGVGEYNVSVVDGRGLALSKSQAVRIDSTEAVGPLVLTLKAGWSVHVVLSYGSRPLEGSLTLHEKGGLGLWRFSAPSRLGQVVVKGVPSGAYFAKLAPRLSLEGGNGVNLVAAVLALASGDTEVVVKDHDLDLGKVDLETGISLFEAGSRLGLPRNNHLRDHVANTLRYMQQTMATAPDGSPLASFFGEPLDATVRNALKKQDLRALVERIFTLEDQRAAARQR